MERPVTPDRWRLDGTVRHLLKEKREGKREMKRRVHATTASPCYKVGKLDNPHYAAAFTTADTVG
jgi:hypothetical protein